MTKVNTVKMIKLVNNYGNKMIIKHRKTEVTEPSTGLKKAKKQKMVVSKVKNGSKTAVTTENGKTTKNMDLQFKSMGMVTNMKAGGCKTCVTAKVPLIIKLMNKNLNNF